MRAEYFCCCCHFIFFSVVCLGSSRHSGERGELADTAGSRRASGGQIENRGKGIRIVGVDIRAECEISRDDAIREF